MTGRVLLCGVVLLAGGWIGPKAAVGAGAADAETPAVSFSRDIRPLLQQRCQGCHQPARRSGGFDATSPAAMRTPGDSGEAAVLPHDPDGSLLLLLVEGERPAMPPEGAPLSADEAALLRRWIAAGAEDDTPAAARPAVDAENPPRYNALPVVTALDFSPDGSLLAVGGHHEVLLHHADGSGIAARLVGLSERIEAVAFSPDGQRLAVAGGLPGRMGELQVWNVPRRRLELSLPAGVDTIYGASWSEDGGLIAFGGSDSALRAVDARTGRQRLYQGAHEDWVLGTAFSRDGSHLVSVSRDRSMKLTEVASERFIDNITSITPGALRGGLHAVARHPLNDELLAGGADGTARLYRMHRDKAREIGDDHNLLRTFEPLAARVYAVAFRRDGEWVLAAGGDGRRGECRVWRTADGAPVSRFAVETGSLFAAAFHPAGTAFAAAGFDGLVRIVSGETGELLRQFPAAPLETDSQGTHSP